MQQHSHVFSSYRGQCLYTDSYSTTTYCYTMKQPLVRLQYMLLDQHPSFCLQCPVNKNQLEMEQEIIWDILIRGWDVLRGTRLGVWDCEEGDLSGMCMERHNMQ